MRIIVFILTYFVFCGYSLAQNKNEVESPTEEEAPGTEVLKKEYLEKKTNYKHTSTKGYTETERNDLDQIDDELGGADANSFEYNFVHYLNGNYDVSRSSFLFKAYSLRPNDAEVQKEMFGYYLLTGDKANQVKFAKIIQPLYSSVEYKYYEHLIEDKEKVAIITSGKDDSFPVYVLQLLENKGDKVLVINLDFMQSDEYRATICKALSIENMDFIGNEKKFLSNMITNQTYPTYISTTVHQNYCAHLSNELYLSGLYYSSNAGEQFQSLENFWVSFQNKGLEKVKFKSNQEKQLYKNYLPPLLMLYKLKKLNGTEDKLLKEVILVMGTNLNVKESVETILDGYDTE